MATRGSEDSGYTLVEVIVATVIFLLLGASVTVALTQAIKAAAVSEGRVQAANLVAKQIELARSADPSLLVNRSYDVTRGSLTYHVEQTVVSQTADTGGSSCDGNTGAEALRRISVVTTWDGMGATPAVRADTFRTLPVTGSSATLGTLTFKVVDRNGAPLAGAPITLKRNASLIASKTTDGQGCVVFSALAAGAGYVGSLTQPGSLNNYQLTTVSKATTVVAKTVTKNPGFIWDRASTPLVTAVGVAGYPVPAAIPLTLFDGTPDGSLVLSSCAAATPCATMTGAGTSTATWQVQGLFPAAAGYQVAAGDCGVCTSSPRTKTNVLPRPADSTALTAPALGAAQVTAKSSVLNLAYVPAITLWATNADFPAEQYQFPSPTTAGAAGGARISLPAGKWIVSQAQNEASSLYKTTITISPGAVMTAAVAVR